MSIKVIKAGLQTTIQDLGRRGYREFGIAGNGALDEYSHIIANWLVGNSKQQATLEITQIGPTLEFYANTTVAVAGAEFELFINDQAQPTNTTLQINARDILKFGKLQSGARAYLAIAGQINLEPMMNSLSTNIMAGFGGINGRALKDGDTINITPNSFEKIRQTPKELLFEHRHNLQQHHLIIRFTQGREFNLLSEDSKHYFAQKNYKISSLSNRMAIKLEGSHLALNDELSMPTVPIVPGTVQLPPNGQPIITLADGQTTGGYPRIGQVITADLSLLAQVKPNDTLSFYPVTIEQALSALKKKNEYIDSALNQY